jgi:hypothetical protein
MTQETETPATKEQKVFNLCTELEELKKKKKDLAKSYGDEIKRIQAEINELINPQEEEETE